MALRRREALTTMRLSVGVALALFVLVFLVNGGITKVLSCNRSPRPLAVPGAVHAWLTWMHPLRAIAAAEACKPEVALREARMTSKTRVLRTSQGRCSSWTSHHPLGCSAVNVTVLKRCM